MTANNLRLLLAASLLFFLNQPLFSEDKIRYYDIEMVVFESLEEDPTLNENWPASSNLAIPETAAHLGRKFEGELPTEFNPALQFVMLPVDDFRLKDEVEKLRESENYRLLLHTGWRQPGLSSKLAVPVYFTHAVADLSKDIENKAESSEESANKKDKKEFVPVAPYTPTQAATSQNQTADVVLPDVPLAKLEGVITIVLSRYLHLDVEMLYNKEPASQSVDMFDSSFLEDRKDKINSFYLKQNRRMRSKETHYIDHPKFSMLVRITPYIDSSTYIPPTKKYN